MMQRRDTAGFTIVELLIATAVFSTILLIVAAGVTRFTRQYYKAQITNTTQNAARTAVDQIAQAIQFGGGGAYLIGTTNGGTIGAYCVNNHPYYFALGRQLNGPNALDTTKDALVTSQDELCTTSVLNITSGAAASPNNITNPQELLGNNMRLARFSISGSDPVSISIRVVYGDNDQLCFKAVDGSCQPATNITDLSKDTLRCIPGSGDQYCAVADYSTSAVKRLQ